MTVTVVEKRCARLLSKRGAATLIRCPRTREKPKGNQYCRPCTADLQRQWSALGFPKPFAEWRDEQ